MENTRRSFIRNSAMFSYTLLAAAVSLRALPLLAGLRPDAFAAAVAIENWTLSGQGVEKEEVSLFDRGDAFVLRIPRETIAAHCARRLEITPSFGHARTGEDGFWFSPYGYYGEFDRTNGVFEAKAEKMSMPMFGWRTERGAYLAVMTSLACYPYERVEALDGKYSVSCVLDEELCRNPYADLEIVYYKMPVDATYADLARKYREHQLSRGVVKPFKDRVKGNPVLKAALESPEIRIRQAWKPVPSPVPHQQPENEPEPHVAVTFDRVRDIVREMRSHGIEKAEICLVGWNIGGHDGRWPQAFPAEPRLGGDAKLKSLIADTLAAGYLIVPHGNFLDAYEIADSWDAEWTVKYPDGTPLEAATGPESTWGGGLTYRICPLRAYEKFCTKDIPRMAAFGFKGMGYFDVVSLLCAPSCGDSRHAISPADGARYWGLCAEVSKRELGGFASEGAMDHFAGSLDYALYASFESPDGIEANWYTGASLAKRHVPIFQIVYNGIIASNPFASSVNFTAQSRFWQLKLIEYGGRPAFYFYSKFLSPSEDLKDWMGDGDLRCGTDKELSTAVAKIKEGTDVYAALSYLQYEFIEAHDAICGEVWRTAYSDGSRIYVNYGQRTASVDGVVIPSKEWKLVPGNTQGNCGGTGTPSKTRLD